MVDIFEDIKKRLDKIDLSNSERELLLKHEKITKRELKVGDRSFDAWRILHNNALGPGKGGIRFHPGVNEDEVKSLSFWMSLKTSLMGLPLGGGKGGVSVDPRELSEEELEELSRAYGREFSDVIGVDKDIPAPDVYTNSKIMGWIKDEFEKVKDKKEPGVITGKSLEEGGIAMRADATSKGGYIVLKELMEKEGLIGKSDKSDSGPMDKITVAVQGFGNAGSHVARMLHEDGFKVVSVSDSKGGIYDENGLDIDKLIRFKAEGNSVSEMADPEHNNSGASKIDNTEILESEVDVLVLAALENQVTAENADKIKAKYILELANGPVNFEADEILFEKEIKVVPDILANAGGVVVSYFEWDINRGERNFDQEALDKEFNEIMTGSFDKVYELSGKENIDMRTASYKLAIDRILEAERKRGNLE
jgi:glutamate dehydrogenase/leucine dehydrogenase